MKSLENSTSFSTLAGVSSALLPILFAAYGNPVRGITAFSKKLHVDRAETDCEVKTGGDTFLQKIQRLRESDPEGFEKYRLETMTLVGNIAAGSDTTSISLTGALYRIFTTKGTSQRLYEELDSQSMLSEERITCDQAQQLPYLQMVIKEALRIHPVVGLPMWREVNGTGLEIDGTHLPPGVSIMSFQISVRSDANGRPGNCRHQPMGRAQESTSLWRERRRIRAGALGSKEDFRREVGRNGSILLGFRRWRTNLCRQTHIAS